MSEAARKILEEALRLSAEERSLIAKQLLDSVAGANDAMEPEELAALDAAIEETYADEEAGRVRDLFEAFPQLRSELDAEERVVLHREIAASIAERKAGEPTVSAEEALVELGSRR